MTCDSNPMHFKPLHLIAAFLPLGLTGCAGTFGTLAWRSWNDHGTRVTEIKSLGFESRNLPGFCGTVAGWRHTVYCSRSDDELASTPESAIWNYFWAPGPEEIPLHLSELTYGLETGWTPTFAGTAIGITSRSMTILPADGHETLSISLNTNSPENARFHLQATSR